MTLVEIEGEKYYKIENSDTLRPFFMSIVSDSDHWMFISSNGGLSAGRKNADFALFPYYTDDKITELADITGSKTIFQIRKGQQKWIWEPFTERFNDTYSLTRNLYKSFYGNSILFEEIHNDFQLTFRYQWSSSHRFGFVKKSSLISHSNDSYDITFLDGLQNVMPHGVNSDLQNSTSNLVDAYKRSELHSESGLGIFALSAIIVDKAEPSEALKANVVWSLGTTQPVYLLSSKQLPEFRKFKQPYTETDSKGEKGAYFISSQLQLASNASKTWNFVANVNLNQAQVLELCEAIIHDATLEQQLTDEVLLGTQKLIALNAAADGLQYTADKRTDARHFSNVLFNSMRGGIFDENYQIGKEDFVSYFEKANEQVFQKNASFFDSLDQEFSYIELLKTVQQLEDKDVIRLCTEYLPLKFSRRHGDPSRPWNKFSINTRNETDGSKVLDYQGNWRDIFQNWEALAYSYPNFIEGMIHKFLNASTFDGYNPYRVTKSGFDWEAIEPDNPWSYIGYWGDHQIIYLLKFLEFSEKFYPGKLQDYFDKDYFVYAAVPYIIKPYQDILLNPKDTIEYSHSWEKTILNRKALLGADGALLFTSKNEIHHVNFIEKILATLLAKLSNFIPEGGIWMNTQRPEWNDANNALVGNGVSMVTLYYLRRFITAFDKMLDGYPNESIKISNELFNFFQCVSECFIQNETVLHGKISDKKRKEILDELGESASKYRLHIYTYGFSGQKQVLDIADLKEFSAITLQFLDHTIAANKREDQLFHAYNLMSVVNDGISVSYLSEMLEGQVAVLSSGYLSANEALQTVDALRKSALYRADQNSYILYPNKELPKFLEKNCIPEVSIKKSKLLSQLTADANVAIINKDVKGTFHFNGNFHNANDVKNALLQLQKIDKYRILVEQESGLVLQIFEEVFNHKAFTGRSGTFFGYEGLGSIYWHMVSKLHLAVQEVVEKASVQNESDAVVHALTAHYLAIGDGIGVHKTPEVYGAFPTDPYSHTPAHRGAQQPGMTGQVKEDVLTRRGELGLQINEGVLTFHPTFLNKNQFLNQPEEGLFYDLHNKAYTLTLRPQSLAFSVCQVPVIYQIGLENSVEVHFKDGKVEIINSLSLDQEMSQMLFHRTGAIVLLKVCLKDL
ncbi:hypothetical protein ACSVH5_02580 [Flavobacterium sp. RSSA_27]|uniref:hypothetical protein n=1 Tax=Flavobacterium sp. RSSA_27 TaxID=3447667 RepID=UPI003F319CF8